MRVHCCFLIMALLFIFLPFTVLTTIFAVFGQASAATTGTAPHQYALLCSGIPSLNSFYLRRYDINNSKFAAKERLYLQLCCALNIQCVPGELCLPTNF